MKTVYLFLPYRRCSLTAYLKALSNKEYQLKNWIAPSGRLDFKYYMEHAFEWLEDLRFFDYPATHQIGHVLYDEEEAKLISVVAKNFNELFQKIGWNQPDEKYINSPYWDAVVESAKKAYPVFQKNDDQYGPLLRAALAERFQIVANGQLRKKFDIQSSLSFWSFFKEVYLHLDTYIDRPYPHQLWDWIVKNDEEVAALIDLREAIESFLKDTKSDVVIDGWDAIYDFEGYANDVYLNSPYLDKVQEAAQKAYDIFMKNGV